MQRWDIDDYYETFEGGSADKIYVRSGAFLDHVDLFDNNLFGISKLESVAMDPQQRLLLEEIYILLQGKLNSEPYTGVYVGCMYHEYLQHHLRHERCISPLMVTGNGANYMVSRISYIYNFQGPSISVDTACSSSLVSLHQAGFDIKYGSTVANLVGGTNLMLLPSTFQGICQLKALSRVGRCQTFDAKADGYGRGEAILVGHLSPRPASNANGLVIKASAINQDGRSNGLVAPNGTSQQSLMKMNLSHLQGPDFLCMQSLHGTGTTLGDPIEVSAIRESTLGIDFSLTGALTMESSKSILGHTEGAAGMAGVALSNTYLEESIRTQIRYLRSLNPFVRSSLHEYGSNPMLPLASSPAYIPSGAHAATSSFGMGGTNAHAVFGLLRGRFVDEKERLSYLKSSHWPVIQSHHLIRDFYIHRSSIHDYRITLASSDASTLLHHNVKNRALIPGAFFICLSASITKMLSIGKQSLLIDTLFLKPKRYPETIESAYLSFKIDGFGGIRAMDATGDSLFISRAALGLSIEKSKQRSDTPNNTTINAKINLGGGTYSANIIAEVNSRWQIDEDLQAVTSSDSSFHLAAILSNNLQTYVPNKLSIILLEDCMPETKTCFASSSISVHSEFDTSLSDIRVLSCGKMALQACEFESKIIKADENPTQGSTSAYKILGDSKEERDSSYQITYSVYRPLANTFSFCKGLDATLFISYEI